MCWWMPVASIPSRRVLFRVLTLFKVTRFQKTCEPPSLVSSIHRLTTYLKHCSGIDYDDAGSIIGYWGLSLSETNYRFEVDGCSLYTWCAWDALFIPAIIRKTAIVTSHCPVTGSPIRLTVSASGVESVNSSNTVVSFIKPETVNTQKSIVKNFCHYVYFFNSEGTGAQWVSANPGTFLITLKEAFAFGYRKNELQYAKTWNE